MPFDPNLPQENTLADAAQMRSQFNGLKELIDAIPAGPPGEPGEQGPPGADGQQGPPGEISLSQLNDAIAGTARNPADVATLDTPFGDPDAETLRQAYNTLVAALFRAPT